MKLKRIFLSLLLFFGFVMLTSCSKKDIYAGYIEVIFELEGGQCQNATDKITLLCDFGELDEMLIPDPNKMITEEYKKITMTDHYIEGWYKNKIEGLDGKVAYEEKWNFETDMVTKEGITLYAKWMPIVYYSFDVYFKDINNNDVMVNSYMCEEGMTIDNCTNLDTINLKISSLKLPNKYTAYEYVDENGNPWDHSFKHPGGTEDNRIKVYANVLNGSYSTVSTADEFKKAIAGKSNIVLLNDIDLGGASVDFDKYTKHLFGNNHKVFNFNISYDYVSGLKNFDKGGTTGGTELYISLFYELDGAKIQDVEFNDVTIDIDIPDQYVNINDKLVSTRVTDIVITPLATIIEDSIIENVSFTGTYKYTHIPERTPEIIPVVIKDRLFFKDDGGNEIIRNNTINFEKVE